MFILSVILVVSFISVSYFNFRTTERSVRREIVSSSLPLMRENIYSEILREISPPIHVASLMATDSFLINWALEGEKDVSKITQYLSEIHNRYGYFSAFFISENTKNYYHYDGILKQISPEDDHDVWYYTFIAKEKEYELDVDTDEAADHALTIFINYRLEDYEGNLLGVTGVGLRMANFSGLLESKQEKYNRRIFLVDRNGLIQAHSEEAMIEEISVLRKPGIEEVATVLLQIGEGPIDAHYRGDNGTVLVTSRYIEEMDWFLIVEQDEAAALGAARKTMWRTLLIGLLTSAVIVAISGVTIGYFQRRLEYLAVTDGLTNVPNRRAFESQFRKTAYRFFRYGTPVSLTIVDIDKFKEINDTEGHQAGDDVLKEVSRMMQENIRPDDMLARWGGDEFVLLFECDTDEAIRTAERLRRMIKKNSRLMELNRGEPITLSIGIAGYSEGDTLESLTGKADKALYHSKREGRDRISVYQPEG